MTDPVPGYGQVFFEGEPEALADLDRVGAEIDLHRRFGDYYAYEFFVAPLTAG